MLDGVDVNGAKDAELSKIRNKKIGFVFQGYQLLSKLTAADNVAFPLMLRGVPASERARRSSAALARVALSGRAQRCPSKLIGGHPQRVPWPGYMCYSSSPLPLHTPTGSL